MLKNSADGYCFWYCFQRLEIKYLQEWIFFGGDESLDGFLNLRHRFMVPEYIPCSGVLLCRGGDEKKIMVEFNEAFVKAAPSLSSKRCKAWIYCPVSEGTFKENTDRILAIFTRGLFPV